MCLLNAREVLMVFKELELKSLNIYNSFFKNNNLYNAYYASELNFKVIYLWRHFQKLENYICSDYIIVKGFYDNQVFFLAPLTDSEENFIKGVNLIREYCEKEGIPVVIKALTPSLKNLILKHFTPKKINEDRNFFEYIYLTEELSKYEGKKFHDKKNLLNQFNKYNFEFKKYSENLYPDFFNVLNNWNNSKTPSEIENIAIENCLKVYKEFDITCELLYIDGKAEAFIAGCICENNLGMILFEKANPNFKGIYAKLNNYYTANNLSGCKYVSMQEDMGILGLRQSKKSYNPVFLEEKYIAYL